MIDLYKEINLSQGDGQSKDKQYEIFLKQAAKDIAKEDSENLKKIKKPQFDQQLQNHLIVIGIPVVKPDNKEKFLTLFNSLLDKKKIGKNNGLQSIDVGMENDVGNQTLYIVYKEPSQAKTAFKKLNNLKFSKENTLTCFFIKQIQQVIKFNPEFKTPTLYHTQQKMAFNFEHQRMSQFAVRQGNDILIRWLDHIDKTTDPAISKEYIQNNQIKINKVGFSPKGSYMVVCSDKGTYLYGGNDLQFKASYLQESPIDFKFSHDEKYMITFNGNDIKNNENFIIWAVEQEIKLKSYRAWFGQTLQSFKFNKKSSRLALIIGHDVFFYNLENLQTFKNQLALSQEQSNTIKAPNVQKIAWLQDNDSLVCVCYQINFNPNSIAATRIFVYNVETKSQRKWRTWTEHAKKGQIIVSDRGDWVAIVMKKAMKKNHFSTVIQVANLLKNDDPMQISTLQIKSVVGNVSWDFKGNRFALIYEDENTRKGINVKHVLEFYQIVTKGKKMDLVKIKQIKNVLSNRISLSPSGVFFCAYNILENSPERGKISFGMFVKDKKDKKMSNIQWIKQNLMVHQLNFFKTDPSGRFVILGTEKSYQVWNMIGQMVFKDTLNNTVNDIQWRPRALNTLPDAEQEKLAQREKEIRKKYQELDIKKLDFLRYQKEQARKQQKADFLVYLQKKREWAAQYLPKRKEFLGFDEVISRTAVYQVLTDMQVV